MGSDMLLLIEAKLDDMGDIDWVWHWRPHFLTAKPVSSFLDIEDGFEVAKFSGASREAIMSWFTRNLVDMPSNDQSSLLI